MNVGGVASMGDRCDIDCDTNLTYVIGDRDAKGFQRT